jgi:hypothetical protein
MGKSRCVRRRLRDERGSMLVELLIAMTFLGVTIGALMSVYTSSVMSLRHSSIEGNALTLVDKKLEIYRTLPYDSIALNSGSIPSASDIYATKPPGTLSAVQKSSITSGQATGGTYSATETVIGPDNRTYRVDTYIFPYTPSTGQAGKQVTVTARLVTGATVGTIRAQSVSAFDLGATVDAMN